MPNVAQPVSTGRWGQITEITAAEKGGILVSTLQGSAVRSRTIAAEERVSVLGSLDCDFIVVSDSFVTLELTPNTLDTYRRLRNI